MNRVWQYHFGKGLAPNGSDLGRLGELQHIPNYSIGWRLDLSRKVGALRSFIGLFCSLQPIVKVHRIPICKNSKAKTSESVLLAQRCKAIGCRTDPRFAPGCLRIAEGREDSTNKGPSSSQGRGVVSVGKESWGCCQEIDLCTSDAKRA